MNEVPLSALDSLAAPAQLARQLAAAREGCGFSVADVARQLKLSPWQVEAMEAGNYQRLPGPVFVRGFIRNYARLVKLDPAPLLASAEQQLPPAAPPEPALPHSVNIPFSTGREFWWHKYAIVTLLVLAVLVIYEFYRDDVADLTVKSEQVELSSPQIVTEARLAAEGAPQAGAVDDAAARPARDASAAEQSEKPAPETAPPAAPPAKVTPGPAEHRVRLSFERESWVEIRDRYGRKIFSQLNPAGTEQAVSGQPPLTLVVGNAAAVRLIHNDQRVDLAPHTKVDVARLTLE